MKVEISKWMSKFKKQSEEVEKKNLATFHIACDMVYQRIIDRTPIGNPNLWNPPYWPKNYKPGFLKSNWKIEKEKTQVTISNDAPYAQRIEDGWSYLQAPVGMVKVTLLEFPSMLKAAKMKTKL